MITISMISNYLLEENYHPPKESCAEARYTEYEPGRLSSGTINGTKKDICTNEDSPVSGGRINTIHAMVKVINLLNIC